MFIYLFLRVNVKFFNISFYSKKYPEDELIELFGEGSGDLTSEKFHPGWFLLQHHHATTFEDLKAGLAFLKRKVNSQKEGQLSFLKVTITIKNKK